jgi:hypothetical protein
MVFFDPFVVGGSKRVANSQTWLALRSSRLARIRPGWLPLCQARAEGHRSKSASWGWNGDSFASRQVPEVRALVVDDGELLSVWAEWETADTRRGEGRPHAGREVPQVPNWSPVARVFPSGVKAMACTVMSLPGSANVAMTLPVARFRRYVLPS